jgi:type I restriction-modification system DNA methylase subunit
MSLSEMLSKKIDNITRKNQGIYFTPPNIVLQNIEILKPFLHNVKNILEPSCGSGEFIQLITQYCTDVKITGVEINNQIFDTIISILPSFIKPENELELYNTDYLIYDDTSLFDLIIGNPPYFVMKKDNVSKDYYPYFDGRPNIFILFIIKSLKLLKINGILSFILPKNFLNCLYYNKIREYIISRYTIITITDCDGEFKETKQETVIFIVQNKKDDDNINNSYYIIVNGYTIFGTKENIQKIMGLYQHATSLASLNCVVNVGNVVWNQVKSLLTDDTTKTRLIYSSDISNGEFQPKVYSNHAKKNYICKDGNRQPILLINRGYGIGNYKFEYCLFDEDCEYLVENHLICIKPNKEMSMDELLILYNKIIQSLTNEKTSQFIELYFGNNAINTTELREILPIYIE